MHLSRRTVPGLLLAVLLLAVFASSATAAPITVQLRVEGASATLFEGNITTDAATFETPSSNGPHPCDYTDNGPSGGHPTEGNSGGTPTTALRDAALSAGLAFDAEWFGSGAGGNENPGDFFVTRVGSDANQNVEPFDSWGYAVNNTTAPVGGCQVALAPGNEVLWAYNYFNLKHLLAISGPASASAGAPFTVHVTDAQTGAALSGAAIGVVINGVTTTLPSSATTDAGGNATIALAGPGVVTLKATRADSVRSNGLSVCVHNGNDGTCGTVVPGSPPGSAPLNKPPPPTATIDVVRIIGLHNGAVYRHRAAPRILRGSVTVPTGGTLRDVRISLVRRAHGHCYTFSGLRGKFVRARCGKRSFFSVGGSESFSYLLPARLPAGRYVFDIKALESSGRMTPLIAGVSQAAFRVR
jgi:hypothetical protein